MGALYFEADFMAFTTTEDATFFSKQSLRFLLLLFRTNYNNVWFTEAVTISSSSDNDSIVMIRNRRSHFYRKTPINANRKRKRISSHQNQRIRNRIAGRTRRNIRSPSPNTESYTPHTRLRLRNAIRVSSSVVPDKTSLRNRLNTMLGKKTESEEKTTIEKASEESDNELESLRQMALNSKTLHVPKLKLSTETNKLESDAEIDADELRIIALNSKTLGHVPKLKLSTEKNKSESDGEIDANELRIIALKSAMQKMMQKKGYPKRIKRSKEKHKQTLSQLFSEDMIHKEIEELYQNELESEFITENTTTPATNIDNNVINLVEPEMIFPPDVINNSNSKIIPNYSGNFSFINGQLYFDNFQYINPNSVPSQDETENVKSSNVETDNHAANIQDELLTEDDELALREQLLSSIKHIEKKLTDQPIPVTVEPPRISPVNIDDKSNFIIRLGESDSESDCEEIKNLTKMHKKLTDPTGFQDQLEVVLKTIRCNVEKAHITVKQKNQEKATKNSLSVMFIVNNLFAFNTYIIFYCFRL